MKKILQIEDLTKREFIEIIHKIIDRKLDILSKTDENEKLSIKEVAEELGVSELTIHNYIKKGHLPALKISRRVFIKRIDLDEALKEIKSLKYKR